MKQRVVLLVAIMWCFVPIGVSSQGLARNNLDRSSPLSILPHLG